MGDVVEVHVNQLRREIGVARRGRGRELHRHRTDDREIVGQRSARVHEHIFAQFNLRLVQRTSHEKVTATETPSHRRDRILWIVDKSIRLARRRRPEHTVTQAGIRTAAAREIELSHLGVWQRVRVGRGIEAAALRAAVRRNQDQQASGRFPVDAVLNALQVEVEPTVVQLFIVRERLRSPGDVTLGPRVSATRHDQLCALPCRG